MEVFLRYELGGFIFGGAYTWRGLFLEFYGNHLDSFFVSLSCVKINTKKAV